MPFIAGQPLDAATLNGIENQSEGYNVMMGGALDFTYRTNYLEMTSAETLSFMNQSNGKAGKLIINNTTGSNQTLTIPSTSGGGNQTIDFTPGYTVVDVYWVNSQAVIQV